MLSVYVENVGDMAIIDCQGRIVQSESAFKLRKAVMSQLNSKVIVLDLTEVYAVEGGGLGMLSILQIWANGEGIQLKLFNPRSAVKNKLDHNDSVKFNIAPFEEMMNLLSSAEGQQSWAA